MRDVPGLRLLVLLAAGTALAASGARPPPKGVLLPARAAPDAGARLDAGAVDAGPPRAAGARADEETPEAPEPPESPGAAEPDEAPQAQPEADGAPEHVACSPDRWCTSTTPSRTNGLSAIHGISADDAWAVGDEGLILHLQNRSWSTVPSHTQYPLRGVWAASAVDAYACGEFGTLLRWNGQGWKQVLSNSPEPLYAIWGTSPADVYAVGDHGMLTHYDGIAWRPSRLPTAANLRGIWGTGPTDVWVVGDLGTVLHWNGRDWKPFQQETERRFNAVHGTSPIDVWAVAAPGAHFTAIHWDGRKWSRALDTPTELRGVFAASPHEVFAVSDYGVILHLANGRWTTSTAGQLGDLRAIWGTGASDVWAVGGGGTLLLWDGKRWSVPEAAHPYELRAMWGASADDAWAVGTMRGNFQHWNGADWSELGQAAPDVVLRGLWGTAADDIWAVGGARGRGVLYRYDGKAWAKAEDQPRADLQGIAGVAPNFALAVGVKLGDKGEPAGGAIVRWDKKAWTYAASTTKPLRGVAVRTPEDAWAVGDGGLVVRWNGAAWAHVESGTRDGLVAAWTGSATDAWLVGGATGRDGHGTVLHWDGAALKSVPNPGVATLRAIAGVANDLWAAGDEGVLLHYDGKGWITEASGVTERLYALWDASPKDTWAVGYRGMILRHR